MGINKTPELKPIIENDIRSWAESAPLSPDDPHWTLFAHCILINIDECTCEILSTNSDDQAPKKSITVEKVIFSEFIASSLSTLLNLHNLAMPADSCIMYLEDRLMEIVSLTILLLDLLGKNEEDVYSYTNITELFQLGKGDVSLLCAISSIFNIKVKKRIIFDMSASVDEKTKFKLLKKELEDTLDYL